MKVAIVGAGVCGLVCGLELLRRNHEVSIIEAGSSLGPQACSWVAGGMLSPWCEHEIAPKVIVELGQQSIQWWHKNVAFMNNHGSLVVAHARDQSQLIDFSQRTNNFKKLTGKEINELEPDLENTFSDALFFAEEGAVDPHRVLNFLLKKIQAANAQVIWNKFISNLSEVEQEFSADYYLDCRGFGSKLDQPDLRGVRGEMAIIRCEEVQFKRTIRLLHPRTPIYLVPRENHIYMLGATMLESESQAQISLRSLNELLNACYSLHPAFAEAEVLQTATGLRPAYLNNMPKIRQNGKWISVNGCYRHGFLLAPALASMVVNIVSNKHVYANSDIIETGDAQHTQTLL